MKRKILSIFTAFVCVMTACFCFSGCGTATGNITNSEVADILEVAANNFYSKHRNIENFSDITYHYAGEMTSMEKFELSYLEEPNDDPQEEDYVKGVFENKTVVTNDITIAIKKAGEHLVSEINIVKTTVHTSKELNLDETLNDIDDTTVETSKYRVLAYTEESEEKNILIYDYDKTENGEAVVGAQRRLYAEKKTYSPDAYNMEGYDNFATDYLIGSINSSVNETFFGFSEYLLYNMISAEKDGDQLKCGVVFDYVTVIQSGWGIVRNSMSMEVLFNNGNIGSANMKSKAIADDHYHENVALVEYENSATVDMTVPEDLSAYTEDSAIWQGNIYEYTLTQVLSDLPNISIF